MERIPQANLIRRLTLVALLPLAGGCVTTSNWLGGTADGPPVGVPCQVVATWDAEVRFAPDPVRGGMMAPGLAGRLYLFGPQIDFPMGADGSVVVDLFDATHPGPLPAAPLEEWRIDRETLLRLQRRDAIGWGYTLFLPWGTYRPDLGVVQLKVRYEPAKGTPLYAENAPLTLRAPGSNPVVQTSHRDASGLHLN
jgi:hypothetical protein